VTCKTAKATKNDEWKEHAVKPFSYSRAEDTAAAVAQIAPGKAMFLAGGTNLVDFMKLEVETPDALVEIAQLPLDRIEKTDAGVRIGAMVRNTDLAYDEIIRERYPLLSQALLAGATPQIRNMATVGGNLLQRTRCTYFRDLAWSCNKREPGSGCSAIDGYNRSHAILGASDQCIATHPSDMCVAMVALEAIIFAESSAGKRQFPIADFFVPYGDDPAKENTLKPGELITHVELPRSAFFRHSHYLKVRDRASFEFALASAAVALGIDGGKITEARVALGGVATKPWRATEAETVLLGEKPNKATFTAAADAALKNAQPQKHNAFKVELAKRTIVRALETVAAIT
jgi:xanthine dehydrogenase YagS FAD-binding subunit